MAKYLLLWEMDPTRVPENPKERAAAWTLMLNMVKHNIEQGKTLDWGVFPGELKGYSIAEGNEVEVMEVTQQYSPYATFSVHPVASVSQVEELLAAMSEG